MLKSLPRILVARWSNRVDMEAQTYPNVGIREQIVEFDFRINTLRPRNLLELLIFTQNASKCQEFPNLI